MDMEKFGELMKAKLGSFPEFEGICYPLAHPFREKGAEKVLQDIFHIQSRVSDIMICTYPKSGTHWINEVSNMLLRNKTELDSVNKVMTIIEFIPDLTVLDELQSPRLLTTHFLFRYLPKGQYGSWYNHEKELEKAEKDYPGIIFTCYYEELKKDTNREIKKLADFLNIQCTESTVEDIAKATSFQNMKQHKIDDTKDLDGKGFIYRKVFSIEY
ncbi:sulfotransferase 1B1-like [Mytilus californianus]|uniref:sulfotransferase 1B1-like n=1 Tax=Mytilus californianus TaxID=6549 RepID=UPI002245A8CA|nr:sulfotransferase 1B1-like [Mytilus californianus]